METESITQSYEGALAELEKVKRMQSLVKLGSIIAIVVVLIAAIAIVVTQVIIPAQRNAALRAAGLPSNLSVLDKVTLGSYEQDGITGNGAEPIEWRVLSMEGDKVLLLAERGLDARIFNETVDGARTNSNDWESSDLKAWLESEFAKNAGLSKVKGTITCLSAKELGEHMPNADDRTCIPTAYAVSQGISTSATKGGCNWWLRSAGDRSNEAIYVNGADGKTKAASVTSKNTAIRPAIWIEL